MFPPKPKKKPGLDIAIGKPKGGLDAPDPVDAPKMPKMPDPEEAAESPDEESSEEYGAKLISDMTAPLISLGLDEATAKSTLGEMFAAAAKCLSGESDPTEHDAGGMDLEGDAGYGR